MAIIRAQIAWAGDTAFPRDRMSINPHFKVTNLPGLGTGYQGLADDLAAGIKNLQQPGGTGREVQVSLYDAEHAPPNTPLATKKLNSGTAPVSTSPREVAVCLSYYADRNEPRRRGRLYFPLTCFYGGAAGGAIPSNVIMDAVAAFVPVFTGLGGLNVDWCVWSRSNNAAYTVTNWFVDNEWDTIRSRGLRPTARNTGTSSG